MTLHRPFKSVLIANRGEIAVRIVREAKAASLRAVAVYSDADKYALHVTQADAAVHIGPAPAQQSYLNVAAILAAAKSTGAEAIHPGYGFLSENADFAQTVIDEGLVWIGPSPDAIRAMGDKGNAKEIARKAGVPVIPGYDGDDQSDAKLVAEARKIGWPVLIKAALGGGGRGQRRVAKEGDFADALAAARRESLSAFASDRMILERALEDVRHIEVQVFGDSQGNIIHLGERDCSVQRRNQKIIEEAPAPGMTPELRAEMGKAAVNLARAVGYVNAGTVEYLLDRDGRFDFLEMNTRIQVEHPVTEEITGLNLIRMQFDIARGKPLGLSQGDIHLKGHAVEVRLCAEDPADGFKPQTGRIVGFASDGATRFDGGVARGQDVSAHYDSMLGKLIARGETREEAIAHLRRALQHLVLLGVTTNKSYLLELLDDPAFLRAHATTAWLASRSATPPEFDMKLAQIAALALARGSGGSWSSTGVRRTVVNLAARGVTRSIVIENEAVGGMTISDEILENGFERFSVALGDNRFDAKVTQHGHRIDVDCVDRAAAFEDITYAAAEPKNANADGTIRAPMAGKIVRVNVEPGATVAKGQVLVILEAMKMEHEIVARGPGAIATVSVKPGDQVAARQVLATLIA